VLDFYSPQDSQFVLRLQHRKGPSIDAIITIQVNFALSMLTEHENRFIDYWEHNRIRKKKVLKQLSVGLPLGVLLVIAICINFFSGWYRRAQMMINTDPSIILVIIIASLLIVIFIAIFSVQHNWDLNEQRYRELVARRDRKE
jgi:uncharacterized membrane protein